MKHFKYIDHSEYPKDRVVFECDAESILEADKKYKEATDKDVVKQPYIGCQIQELKEFFENSSEVA
jgi:hypothetical protein